jgi:transposase
MDEPVADDWFGRWVSRKPLGLSGQIKRLLGMAMNFLACDREQPFLMPPDPRDWLPEDHLAWFLLAFVEQMNLSAFYGSYRVDGWGRAAFEPSMMVSLLLYVYARGERSSRGNERKCVEDVAYRVIEAQQTPDHAMIARFRARHEDARRLRAGRSRRGRRRSCSVAFGAI